MKKECSPALRALFYLVQLVWGLPQALLGAALWLRWRHCPHLRWRGAFVTVWPVKTSMSLGCFLFVSRRGDDRLLVHEYGHSIQSLLLGPLYLPVIGLPSFMWCRLPALRRYRDRKALSYYRLYTESWANRWGEAVTGLPSPARPAAPQSAPQSELPTNKRDLEV